MYEIRFRLTGDIFIKEFEPIIDKNEKECFWTDDHFCVKYDKLNEVLYQMDDENIFHTMFTNDNSSENIQRLKDKFMTALQNYSQEKYKALREHIEKTMKNISDIDFWIEDIRNGVILK